MKSKGIALIQILLITAILSVFALYLTTTARTQVNIAQQLTDKSLALIALENAKAELFFLLLTETKKYPKDNQRADNDIVRRWNFHGDSFLLTENVKVSIQDLSGLLPVVDIPETTMAKLLLNNGIEAGHAATVIANLRDWQDIDSIAEPNGKESSGYGFAIRNGKVTHKNELLRVEGVTPAVYNLLYNYISLYRSVGFNPLLAPSEILHAFLPSYEAQEVIGQRLQGVLTPERFTQITNVKQTDNDSNNEISFRFSYRFAVTFYSNVGQANVKQQIIFSPSPYVRNKSRPIDILSSRG